MLYSLLVVPARGNKLASRNKIPAVMTTRVGRSWLAFRGRSGSLCLFRGVTTGPLKADLARAFVSVGFPGRASQGKQCVAHAHGTEMQVRRWQQQQRVQIDYSTRGGRPTRAGKPPRSVKTMTSEREAYVYI
jgi:hypothetical protein